MMKCDVHYFKWYIPWAASSLGEQERLQTGGDYHRREADQSLWCGGCGKVSELMGSVDIVN